VIDVTLYGRPGCHLCDEARAEIVNLIGRLSGVELREVDIEADESLLGRYLERIPVVEVQGVTVSELSFDRDAFARAVHTVGP
jgi:hypothetical protein